MRPLLLLGLVAAATQASAQVVPQASGQAVLRDSAPPTTLTIEQAIDVGINLRGFEFSDFLESRVMKADDLNATNTADNPERVRAEDGPAATVRDGVWRLTVPPASWSVFRFGCGPTGISDT